MSDDSARLLIDGVLWFVDYFPNTVLGMRDYEVSGATRKVWLRISLAQVASDEIRDARMQCEMGNDFRTFDANAINGVGSL